MQSATEIKLEYFNTSRYQPRDGEDREHIEGLALSIACNGLMQAPVGRLIGADGQALVRHEVEREFGLERAFREGARVELAFGNSRLAAFRLLYDIQTKLKHKIFIDAPTEMVEAARGYDFERMPVVIRDMDDLALFEAGIRENNDRKDLDPIERAQAMETYREKFGKTSVEIGQLWHMSDGAVRNTIRLLRLPPSARAWLRTGQISQGTARALVALYDLTEIERAAAEDQDDWAKPNEIVELALSGAKPEQLTAMIGELHRWLRPEMQQGSFDAAPPVEEPAADDQPGVETFETASGEFQPLPAVDGHSVRVSEPVIPDLPSPEEEKAMGYDPDYDPAAPEDAGIPAGMSVSVETVTETINEAAVMEPAATAPVPAPAPIPTPPQPEQAATEVSVTPPAQTPTPAPQPKPEPAPQPKPEPVPAKKLTWDQSTIVITITLWADDGNEKGRPVVLGVRANQDAPKMQMLRAHDLLGHLPPQAGNLMNQIREEMEKES
jgi:ParB-like chromosome segregation protein Spo0J